jgi:hypothetical protein
MAANSNSATITKVPDGDISLGNKNGEIVTLVDAAAAYVTGGYPFQSQANYNNQLLTSTPIGINVDLWKIDTVQPWGGQGGITPVWNPATQKLQMLWGGAAVSSPQVEVPNGTDLSAYTFLLCVIGT